jgi:hypothetical protein
MRKLLLSTTFLLALMGTLSAQQADVASLRESTANAKSGIGISPAGNAFSLLDLSRIKWSHSYAVSFFSGGNTSGSIGLLNTTMNYDISSKLHLAVNLGVLHSPGAMFGRGESKANILPGFRLDYRPSENVLMSISFQKYAGYRPLYGGRYY